MNLIALLSFAWLLSLPFYHFSLAGTLSLDNLIAPILFLYVAVSMVVGAHSPSRTQSVNIGLAVILILVYLMTHAVSLVGTQQAVWSSIYGIAKNMLYFLLPVMFIRTESDLKRAGVAMMGVMIAGSASALMSALGIVSFEFARQAESRLQLEYIPKSVGLFTAYGDMALLVALALLLALGWRTHALGSRRARLLVVIVITGSALVAVVAMQSRNIVFTITVAFFAYYVIGHWRRRSAGWVFKMYASLVFVIGVMVSVVALFSGPLIGWVESLGGTSEAAATVHARLEQYQYGLSLVERNLLFGADAATHERNALLISFIHNLWLKELVQSGLVGVLAMLLFYFRALGNQVSRLKADPSSTARVYIAALIGSLIATQFYPGDTPVFWVIMGLATALPLRESRKEQDAPVSRQAVTPAATRIIPARRGLAVGRR